MATMISTTGRKVTVSIEDKARALQVFDIQEAGRLAVTSGTEANLAYVVQHNDEHSTSCPCGSYKKCSHRIAVDWYLEAQRWAIEVIRVTKPWAW